MARKSGLLGPARKRRNRRGEIVLNGATGNNLKDINVAFPLGLLCAVSGVSGSGKSSLINKTLFPAIRKAQLLTDDAGDGLPFRKITGFDLVDEVVLIDQSPIGRSSRCNPVTYVKAFDEIRKLFAESHDAPIK